MMVNLKLTERRLRKNQQKELEQKAFHENFFTFLDENEGNSAAKPQAQLEQAVAVLENTPDDCYELAEIIANF